MLDMETMKSLKRLNISVNADKTKERAASHEYNVVADGFIKVVYTLIKQDASWFCFYNISYSFQFIQHNNGY